MFVLLPLQSMLCVPIRNNTELVAVLYLEHDVVKGAFSHTILPVLNAIGTQFAICYESLVNIERLNAGKRKLEELSKVKDRFLATLSHELKTPLHSMTMCLGLLSDGTLTPEQRSYVNVLVTSAAVLQRLLTDLVEMSKLRSGAPMLSPTACNLVNLVASVMLGYQDPAAQKGVELVYLCPGDLPHLVWIDGKRFEQLFSVFVDNAIKFSKPGGLVEITVESCATQDDVHDGSGVTRRLRVGVRDSTGPGIPEQFIDKLFEPFSQIDTSDSRKHGGMGNGLAKAKALLDQMRGSVQVLSDGVMGSQFVFELPITLLDGATGEAETVTDSESLSVSGLSSPLLQGVSPMSHHTGQTLLLCCNKYRASGGVVSSIVRGLGVSVVMLDNAAALHSAMSAQPLAVAVVDDEALRFSATDQRRVILIGWEPPAEGSGITWIRLPVGRQHVLDALSICAMAAAATSHQASSPPQAPAPAVALPSIPLPELATVPVVEAARPPTAPPAAEAAAVTSPARRGSGTSAAGASSVTHVLIVEDNAVNAKLLRNILKKMGLTSDIAENGAIGVDMAKAREYDIILMDIQVSNATQWIVLGMLSMWNLLLFVAVMHCVVDAGDGWSRSHAPHPHLQR